MEIGGKNMGYNEGMTGTTALASTGALLAGWQVVGLILLGATLIFGAIAIFRIVKRANKRT